MDHSLWHNMFFLGLPIAEKMLRPVIVYVFLIVGLRLAGKRELAQLNPFDLIVLLTLSNTVQNSIIGDDNSVTGGILGASTLLAVNYFVVRFLYGHERWEHLIEGNCDVLIENGKIQETNLKRELLTKAELETAAHRQGFASLADIDRAVLEVGGSISFFAKTPTPDSSRHQELLIHLEQLAKDVAALKKDISRPAN
ncbi:MAG TPA: YetF domain-containing protein [Lacipirellulaceae bacterium]|nr:YetF domain-containing protein [Lacipirellulaceae bacterium]